jgi:hypothetical protein
MLNLPKLQVTMYIERETLRESNELRDLVLTDDDKAFFRINTGNMNSWHCFIYQLGLLHAKKEIEHWKSRVIDGKP